MPSAFFAALACDAAAAVDAVMGEPWQLLPMMEAQQKTAAAVVDPSRQSVSFLGTFADPEAKTAEANSYDRRQDRRPGVESGHSRVIVSPAVLAVLSLVITQRDLLVRQNDGVRWRVASAFAMAGGSLKLSIELVG